MSSYDTWLNVLTGMSQGSFDKVYLRDASGNMVDLLTLLGTLGGGITDVISQSSELAVTTSSLLFEITSVTLPKLPSNVSKSTIFPLASLRYILSKDP